MSWQNFINGFNSITTGVANVGNTVVNVAGAVDDIDVGANVKVGLDRKTLGMVVLAIVGSILLLGFFGGKAKNLVSRRKK